VAPATVAGRRETTKSFFHPSRSPTVSTPFGSRRPRFGGAGQREHAVVRVRVLNDDLRRQQLLEVLVDARASRVDHAERGDEHPHAEDREQRSAAPAGGLELAGARSGARAGP
jgi:hypothetical protein